MNIFRKKDCLKILYANDAKLFVPVENIDVLSRYGIEDENIQILLYNKTNFMNDSCNLEVINQNAA